MLLCSTGNTSVCGKSCIVKLYLKKPLGCRNRTKNIDMTEILRDIYEAARTQEKANDDLEEASTHVDQIRNTVQLVTTHTHKPVI